MYCDASLGLAVISTKPLKLEVMGFWLGTEEASYKYTYMFSLGLSVRLA